MIATTTTSLRGDTTLEQRRLARQYADQRVHHSIPVEIVDGDVAPRVAGESYYWTTPSGKTIVHHPSAYGWPTLYHASTLRVEVGRDWFARFNGPQI
jgi:hypothetical protein